MSYMNNRKQQAQHVPVLAPWVLHALSPASKHDKMFHMLDRPCLAHFEMTEACILNVVAAVCLDMQVVLAPVALGAVLNQTFPKQMRSVEPIAPLIAVAMTVRYSTSSGRFCSEDQSWTVYI